MDWATEKPENFDDILGFIEGTGPFDLLEQKEGRSDWENIDAAILKAFREIEYENPFFPVTITQIQRRLKSNKCLTKHPSRRTLYNHLYGLKPPMIKTPKRGLIDKGLVAKLDRGKYSSKTAKIVKSLAQEFLIREYYKTVPRLEGKDFENFLDLNVSTINKLISNYEKKSKIPLVGWFYRKKLADLYDQKRHTKANIRAWLYEEFDFIENSTEITMLSSEKIPHFNIFSLRENLAKILYHFLKAQERHVLEKEGSFNPERCSLNIIVNFSPKKENYKKIGTRRMKQFNESKNRAETAKQFFTIWLKKKKGIDIDQDFLAFFFLDAPSSSYILEKYRENIDTFREKVANYKRKNEIGNKEMVNFWEDYFNLRSRGLLPLVVNCKDDLQLF